MFLFIHSQTQGASLKNMAGIQKKSKTEAWGKIKDKNKYLDFSISIEIELDICG